MKSTVIACQTDVSPGDIFRIDLVLQDRGRAPAEVHQVLCIILRGGDRVDECGAGEGAPLGQDGAYFPNPKNCPKYDSKIF